MSPLQRLARETTPRMALRAVVLLCPLLALFCAWPVAHPGAWFVALVVVLAAGFAVLPESWLGATCLGVVVLWWALQAELSAAVLPAALLLLAAHLAGVLLAYGPPGTLLGEEVVRLWLRRGASVAVAVPVVWLVAVAVDGEPEPPGVWVAGLVCAVVVCLVAATAVTQRPDVP